MSWSTGSVVPGINGSAVKKLGVLGRGTYGVVHRAQWNNMTVAVKEMDYSEEQKMAFAKEIELLEKVKHKNIVKLLAHSVTEISCSLIMEYAECGNLYELLHSASDPPVAYSDKHALSWLYQTAQAIAYLHNLKPRPLVHRDVKPPNLLLMNCCRTIKICDFGTACDVHTHMTTNKGSAVWMAPEVFNSKNYSEKCDIFSFGITMWEIFARKKPFADIAVTFAIMWAVNSGKRPPLLRNCPQPLEELITQCWHHEPHKRPSMLSVEKRLAQMTELVIRGEPPEIHLPQTRDRGLSADTIAYTEFSASLPYDTVTEPVNRNPGLYSFLQPPPPQNFQPFINTDPGGSQENLLDPSQIRRRRQSAEHHLDDGQTSSLVPPRPERRPRSSSFNHLDAAQEKPQNDVAARKQFMNKSTSDNSAQLAPYDEVTPSTSLYPGRPQFSGRNHRSASPADEGYRTAQTSIQARSIQAYVSQIDQKYRPLQPDPSNETSMALFKRHQEFCHSYMKLNTELKLLTEREKEIDVLESRGIPGFNLEKELNLVLNDREQLTKFMINLSKQLEKIKAAKLREEAEKDGFQLVG